MTTSVPDWTKISCDVVGVTDQGLDVVADRAVRQTGEEHPARPAEHGAALQPPGQAEPVAQPVRRPRRTRPGRQHAGAVVTSGEEREAAGQRRAGAGQHQQHRPPAQSPENWCIAWYHPIGESQLSTPLPTSPIARST